MRSLAILLVALVIILSSAGMAVGHGKNENWLAENYPAQYGWGGLHIPHIAYNYGYFYTYRYSEDARSKVSDALNAAHTQGARDAYGYVAWFNSMGVNAQAISAATFELQMPTGSYELFDIDSYSNPPGYAHPRYSL